MNEPQAGQSLYDWLITFNQARPDTITEGQKEILDRIVWSEFDFWEYRTGNASEFELEVRKIRLSALSTFSAVETLHSLMVSLYADDVDMADLYHKSQFRFADVERSLHHAELRYRNPGPYNDAFLCHARSSLGLLDNGLIRMRRLVAAKFASLGIGEQEGIGEGE